jgi:hypothetical protein
MMIRASLARRAEAKAHGTWSRRLGKAARNQPDSLDWLAAKADDQIASGDALVAPDDREAANRINCVTM